MYIHFSINSQRKDKKITMKQIIKTLILGLALGGVFAVAPPAMSSELVSAQVNTGLDMTKTGNEPKGGVDGLIKNVINILLWAIGIIAVVMIIIGGIRYATSAGDSNSAKSAMNTILYSVIGLVIAIFAYAIVNFVITNVGTTSSTSTSASASAINTKTVNADQTKNSIK